MSQMTEKQYLQEFGTILDSLDKKTTPFRKDTTGKQMARVKRARADKFFFAATYFPHYITLPPEYEKVWMDPDADIDWVAAGFAPFHDDMFRTSDLLNTFSLIAGFRDCAKSTLLGKIDVMHKLLFGESQFVLIISKTELKAETKVAPIKIEFELNARIRHDFGNLVGKSQWEYGFIVTNDGKAMKGIGRDQSARGEEVNTHRYDHLLLDDISDPTKPDSTAVVKQFVDSVKGGILGGVNTPKWTGLYLCNWTVRGDITDELMTGKHTGHFNKKIYRKLVPNELETKEDRAIARACREAGFSDRMKSAWERRHPTLAVLQEQKDDPDTFNSEKMMIPRNRKDQKFKDHYFRFHTKAELQGRDYVYYTFVDPSAKDAADYKAVITVGLGLRNGEIHIPIMRASIQQQSIDEMIFETYRHRQTYRSKLVGVETNGFQILLKREYLRLQKKQGLLPFKEVVHAGESKESRIERIVPFVKEGTVTFDLEDPDQELLIQQLKAFPNGGQVAQGGLGDDGPDALAGCIELIEKFPSGGGIQYESLQKQEAEFGQGTW